MVDNKRYAVLATNGAIFAWDYLAQKNVVLSKEMIPAISSMNDPKIIMNPESVMFPDNPDDMKIHSGQDDEDEYEQISLGSKSERARQLQEDKKYDKSENDDEQSILIQKIRELVIRFERLLGKYLDPDLPTSRKLRKKYLEERSIFRKEGYIEFIDTIKLKIDALCTFENTYSIEQFDGIDKNGEIKEGNFNEKIKKAKEGDFHSAQEVVNSVMQIVIEEEYGVPRRRLVTKIR